MYFYYHCKHFTIALWKNEYFSTYRLCQLQTSYSRNSNTLNIATLNMHRIAEFRCNVLKKQQHNTNKIKLRTRSLFFRVISLNKLQTLAQFSGVISLTISVTFCVVHVNRYVWYSPSCVTPLGFQKYIHLIYFAFPQSTVKISRHCSSIFVSRPFSFHARCPRYL